MVTDFEQFMNRMLGGASGAPTPTAPLSPPPAPMPQQNTGPAFPAELMSLIQRAAQMAPQQAPPPPAPAPAAPPPQAPLDMTPFIQATGGDPRLMASTAPVAAPPAPRAQEEEPQDAPNGYILVDFQPTPGQQGEFILVPVGLTMPENARVMGDGTPITDPAGIDRARAEGRLLEQQPPEIQGAFTMSRETMERSQKRQQIEGGGTPLTDAGVINPNVGVTRTPEQAAEAQRQLEAQLPTSVTNPAPGAIPYQTPEEETLPEPPVETWTTEELLTSGDEDLAALGAKLREAGEPSIRTDQVVMVRPEDGKIYLATQEEIEKNDLPIHVSTIAENDRELADRLKASGIEFVKPSDINWLGEDAEGNLFVISKEDREAAEKSLSANPNQVGNNPEPSGTELEGLTTDAIRAIRTPLAGGTLTPAFVAAEMEDQENPIYSVPDNMMLVRNNDTGEFQVVDSADEPPSGTTFVLYGGLSDRPDPSIIGTRTEFMNGIAGPAGAALDWLRGQNMGSHGEAAYKVATGNVPDTDIASLRRRAAVAEATGNDDMAYSPADEMKLWAYENPELARTAYEEGYTDPETGREFEGGRAVWEAFIASKPTLYRVVADFTGDPLNLFSPAGNTLRRSAASMIRNAVEEGVTPPTRVARGLDITGRALQAPDEAVNAIFRGGAAGVRGTIGQVPIVKLAVDTITHPTLRTAVDKARGSVRQVTGDILEHLRDGTITPPPTAGSVGVDPRTPLGGPDAEWNLPAEIAEPVISRPGPLLTRYMERTLNQGRDVANVVQEVMSGVPTVTDARGILADLTDEAAARLNPLQREVYTTVRGIQSQLADLPTPDVGAAIESLVTANPVGQAQTAADTVNTLVEQVRAIAPDVDVDRVREAIEETFQGLAAAPGTVRRMAAEDTADLFDIDGIDLRKAFNNIPKPNVGAAVDNLVNANPVGQAREGVDAIQSVVDQIQANVPDVDVDAVRRQVEELRDNLSRHLPGSIRGSEARRAIREFQDQWGVSLQEVTDALPKPERTIAEFINQASGDQRAPGVRDPADPFAGTTLGREIEESDDLKRWGIAAPKAGADREGADRIMDKAWDARERHPDAWQEFKARHDERAVRYHNDQMDRRETRPRGDFGRSETMEEARYVVNELAEDFNQTLGRRGEKLPEYKFKRDFKEGEKLENQRDGWLLEQYIFGDKKESGVAESILNTRVNGSKGLRGKPATNPDPELGRIRDEATRLRDKWRTLREGGVVDEATDAAPIPTTPATTAADVPVDDDPTMLRSGLDLREGMDIRRGALRRGVSAGADLVQPEYANLESTRLFGTQTGVYERSVLNRRFATGDRFADRSAWTRPTAEDATRGRFDEGATLGEQWVRHADEIEANGFTVGEGKDATTITPTREQAIELGAARLLDDVVIDTVRRENPKLYRQIEERTGELLSGDVKLDKDRWKGSKVSDYLKAVERIQGRAVDPVKDELAARMQAYVEVMDNRGGPLLRAYDLLSAFGREIALFNPVTGFRYFLTQLLGNAATATATGNTDIVRTAVGPQGYSAAVNDVRGQGFIDSALRRPGPALDEPMTEDMIENALRDLRDYPIVFLHDPIDQRAAALGISNYRHGVRTIIRDQVTDDPSRPLKIAEFADNMRLGRIKLPKLGKFTGVLASRHIRDAASAMDLSYRKALWGHMMDANIAQARPAMRELMLSRLPRDADRARFDELWDSLPPTYFGADHIRMTFAEFGDDYAETMARDWQSAIGRMDENARQEVRRVFFSGEETNADAALRRVFIFHYWASRALPLYTQALTSHLGFMNAYIRMMGELKEQAESGKYGQAVNGFLFVMGTPLGFQLFIRPDAFLQTFFNFGAQGSDFAPEGESDMARWLRESGLFVNPLIDTAMNLVGLKGEAFTPDPLLLHNQNTLVRAAVDVAKANGFLERTPTPDVIAEFWGEIRQITSGAAEGIIPGAKQIDDSDSTLYAQQQIHYLIQDVAEERGLDPTGPEAQAALYDPDHELYQEAFDRFAKAGALNIGLRIAPTSVLFPKLRIERPDEIRYQLENQPTGTPVEELDPLYEQRSQARSGSEEALRLNVQQDEYHNIGDKDQQKAYSTFNDIRYGGVQGPVKINGVNVTERHLATLSPEDREVAATIWAQENGKAEDVEAVRQGRKDYRDSHPDFAAFVDWQDQVRKFDGGPIGWWQATTQDERNPNAARWLRTLEDMPQDDLERKLTSAEAYMNYAGIRPTTYDPNPIAVRNMESIPYNPAETLGGAPGGYPPYEKKDPVQAIQEDIANYQMDMALYQLQAQAVFGEPINMEGLPPNVRAAHESILRDHGVRPPSLSQQTQDYLQWQAAQEPGADTSIPAFIRWRDQWLNPTGASGLNMEIPALSGQR